MKKLLFLIGICVMAGNIFGQDVESDNVYVRYNIFLRDSIIAGSYSGFLSDTNDVNRRIANHNAGAVEKDSTYLTIRAGSGADTIKLSSAGMIMSGAAGNISAPNGFDVVTGNGEFSLGTTANYWLINNDNGWYTSFESQAESAGPRNMFEVGTDFNDFTIIQDTTGLHYENAIPDDSLLGDTHFLTKRQIWNFYQSLQDSTNTSTPGHYLISDPNSGYIINGPLTSSLTIDDQYNTFLGITNKHITTGSSNVANGYRALSGTTTGSDNVAVGSSALYQNTTGNNSTALGSGALLTSTGSNNMGLGQGAGAYVGNLSNRIFINTIHRSNLAGDTTLSPIVIRQAATLDNQYMSLNGILMNNYKRVATQNYVAATFDSLDLAETVSRTIYVATTGSDLPWNGVTGGDGSEAHPYATLLKAVKSIKKTLNTGVIITIDLAAGTYTEDGLEIDKQLKSIKIRRQAGLKWVGKYTIDVSGLTVTASATPYVYNVTGATFTSNQYQDYFLTNASENDFFPIVSNTTNTINSNVGATSMTKICHNTTILSLALGNVYCNFLTNFDNSNSFEISHVDIQPQVSGAVRFINNTLLDLNYCKITATQISTDAFNLRNNFTGCIMACSTGGLTIQGNRFQFKAVSLRKTGSLSGTGLTLNNNYDIYSISTGGLYISNWTTGCAMQAGDFSFLGGSIVLDNVTTGFTIRNNTKFTCTQLTPVYVNSVTTLLNNGETLNGNYVFLINSLTGTPTNYVGSGITPNGYINAQKNVYVIIPGAPKTLGKKTLTSSSDIGICEISIANNDYVSGAINYTIYATDGTDYQCHTGTLNFSAVSKVAVITSNIQESNMLETNAMSTGTLTDTWTITNGTGKITLNVNAVPSITPTTLYIDYDVKILSVNGTVTPL